MATVIRWVVGLGLVFLVLAGPVIAYRCHYTDSKRLRIVEPGVLYRSGQLSADGLTAAILRHRIRTVVNVQDDVPEPQLIGNWFNRRTVKESDLCRQMGVRYVHLSPDLISRQRIPEERPAAIDQFLELMDDANHYPVLLHCRAGLHRTGVLCAVYRMEYQGWSRLDALKEMKDLGFGKFCTAANDYVKQYVLTYERRRPAVQPRAGE